MNKKALIVGSTGIVGSSLAEHLVAEDWDVYGLARNPSTQMKGLQSLHADLLDAESTRNALEGIRPTHVYYATWSRHSTEAENIAVNGAMMRNLLNALRPQRRIKHFALMTGLKHYLGPFESYAKGVSPPTPFRESQPRLNLPNFYYTLEDEVFEAAQHDGFSWTVHRPHTIVGFASTSVMNMGATLAAYASICRATGRPFAFPGNATQWNGLSDVTDARILAKHLKWASTTPAASNQALHVVNGDVFRWSWMWQRIAEWFGVEPIPYSEASQSLVEQMHDAQPIWEELASSFSLVEPNVHRVASFWHTDGDLTRPFECITDMSKSRTLGFSEYYPSDQSFFDLFERLQEDRIIPSFRH